MRHRLLQWLACPACGGEELELVVHTQEETPSWTGAHEAGERGPSDDDRTLVDVIEGELGCPTCSARYRIADGIPRMVPDNYTGGMPTGHRWTTFDGSLPEYEENFLDMTAPFGPREFLGKLALDAGCGFGRHAFYAGRYGAEVVAMDNSAEAVSSARANTRGLDRVHVIQGDLNASPLRLGIFDLVYSFGVLHHMVEPREGLRSLGQHAKAGGHVQVWVYGPRAGTAAWVSGGLRGAARAMDDEALFSFSTQIARGLRVFSHTPYRVMRHIPLGKSIVSHLPAHDHHQWPFEVVVADIYDRLRIPVAHYITGEQLEAWLSDEGYSDIRVTRRVRNAESFRGMGTKR